MMIRRRIDPEERITVHMNDEGCEDRKVHGCHTELIPLFLETGVLMSEIGGSVPAHKRSGASPIASLLDAGL